MADRTVPELTTQTALGQGWTVTEPALAFVRALDRYENGEIGWRDVQPFLSHLRTAVADYCRLSERTP